MIDPAFDGRLADMKGLSNGANGGSFSDCQNDLSSSGGGEVMVFDAWTTKDVKECLERRLL